MEGTGEIGRHPGPRLSRGQVLLAARGLPPTRPPAPLETRRGRASAATPPRATPKGLLPPCSANGGTHGPALPARQGRCDVTSGEERFHRHFRGLEPWSTFLRNLRGGSDFPPMGMVRGKHRERGRSLR